MRYTWRYRVIPWNRADNGEQWYTLVRETLEYGRVISDSRHAMDEETFRTLKEAVNSV